MNELTGVTIWLRPVPWTNATAVAPVKLEPVMVTWSPPRVVPLAWPLRRRESVHSAVGLGGLPVTTLGAQLRAALSHEGRGCYSKRFDMR